MVCGNAGDSRCVLSRGGVAVPLSFDHKPTNTAEMQRIQKAGGFVTGGRVNGNLALSRAIGDFDFKQNAQVAPEDQAISAKPDIITTQLQPEDDFLVLACDGIWDCMSNDEVIAFVRQELAHTDDLAAICERTFDRCIAPTYGYRTKKTPHLPINHPIIPPIMNHKNHIKKKIAGGPH